MYIWRIEREDNGVGPFRNHTYPLSHFTSDGCTKDSHAHRPTPYSDDKIGRGLYDDEKCACESMGQLYFWFTRADWLRLARNGYRVFRLTVPAKAVVKGSKQVVYNVHKVRERREVSYFTGRAKRKTVGG